MHLLAFELSTEACSVAVWSDGAVRARHEVAPRRHAELALPWAEALLAEAGIVRAQLDAIAVGRGPGAFTGVRLGISIAQGIALALDRPIVPVSTLATLARGAYDGAPARVLAAIDARMHEVYAGAFALDAAGHVTALDAERVAAAEAIALPAGIEVDGPWRGVGTGFAAGQGALVQALAGAVVVQDAGALPHAGDLAALAAHAYAAGGAVAPETVEPAYLRNQVALTIAEQQALRDARG